MVAPPPRRDSSAAQAQYNAPLNLSPRGPLRDGGRTPDLTQYIVIFLKFVQSVVPTIDYDFTMGVTASTVR